MPSGALHKYLVSKVGFFIASQGEQSLWTLPCCAVDALNFKNYGLETTGKKYFSFRFNMERGRKMFFRFQKYKQFSKLPRVQAGFILILKSAYSHGHSYPTCKTVRDFPHKKLGS